jgi:hypothetical protein
MNSIGFVSRQRHCKVAGRTVEFYFSLTNKEIEVPKAMQHHKILSPSFSILNLCSLSIHSLLSLFVCLFCFLDLCFLVSLKQIGGGCRFLELLGLPAPPPPPPPLCHLLTVNLRFCVSPF